MIERLRIESRRALARVAHVGPAALARTLWRVATVRPPAELRVPERAERIVVSLTTTPARAHRAGLRTVRAVAVVLDMVLSVRSVDDEPVGTVIGTARIDPAGDAIDAVETAEENGRRIRRRRETFVGCLQL